MNRLNLGLNEVSQFDIDNIKSIFDSWTLFLLPKDINSRTEFFKAVKNNLPLDPILHSDNNWDALSDSLWSGLEELMEKRIIILWPNARKLKLSDNDAFLKASEILNEIAVSLNDEDAIAGNTKEVKIIQEI